MAERPGRTLARELIEQSRAENRRTPMEDIIPAARFNRSSARAVANASAAAPLPARSSSTTRPSKESH